MEACPRVLHIMSGYGGGISAFIRNKAETFKDKDVRFDVVTFDVVSDSFKQLIEDTGGKVYKIDNPKKKGFRSFYLQVNQIMKGLPKHTLIHSHVFGVIALPFYLIAKKNRLKRFVIHAHTAAPSYQNHSLREKMKKWLNRQLSKEKLSCGLKASNNIFGPLEYEKKNIVHIPNSINYNEFSKKQDKKKLKREILGIEDDRLIIGSIARFREIKNHYFMIEVIEELKKLGVSFMWFFAGDGLLRAEIESLVREKELTEYVTFLGFREDIPNLFEMMDIFTLPSLNEGLPTVVIEAQATSTMAYVSDTITHECDLGLGLVKYLSIKDKYEWAKEIQKFENRQIDQTIIEQKLIDRKFTNETSAELYRQFLDYEVTYYNI
jgi:glycosyltransferase EpsF